MITYDYVSIAISQGDCDGKTSFNASAKWQILCRGTQGSIMVQNREPCRLSQQKKNPAGFGPVGSHCRRFPEVGVFRQRTAKSNRSRHPIRPRALHVFLGTAPQEYTRIKCVLAGKLWGTRSSQYLCETAYFVPPHAKKDVDPDSSCRFLRRCRHFPMQRVEQEADFTEHNPWKRSSLDGAADT
ncbi:MAG: hypothetical protein JWL77_3427 [Chthonomonadaceae bacterium]|nr:hypothetical protein [Chthonomonadaceae bacterium]